MRKAFAEPVVAMHASNSSIERTKEGPKIVARDSPILSKALP